MNAIRGRTRYPGTIDPKLGLAFNPLSVNGCLSWIDFSDKSVMFTDDGITRVTTNGDAIYRINDKSGNGNYFYQTVEANRPLYRPAVNIGAAEFDGTNDHMSCSNLFIAAGTGTILAVIYLSSTSEKGAVAGAGIQDHGWHFGVGGSSFDNSGNDFIAIYSTIKWVDSNDAIGTGTKLLTLKMSSYSMTMYINGTQNHTSAPSTALPTTGMTIGGEGTGRCFTDHISEVVYYESALSDENRTLVENYLKTKHGIS